MWLISLLFYLARCFPQLFEGFSYKKKYCASRNIPFVSWPTHLQTEFIRNGSSYVEPYEISYIQKFLTYKSGNFTRLFNLV